jgi:hypothetical protein
MEGHFGKQNFGDGQLISGGFLEESLEMFLPDFCLQLEIILSVFLGFKWRKILY